MCCQTGESLIENLPDIDAVTGEVVTGDDDGGNGGGSDGLAALSRQDLCALVRRLRTENAELQVRVRAAEVESAHFRKKLDVAKQKLTNVSNRKRFAVKADE